MSCRASWLNEENDKSILVDKKDNLDNVISKISGVEFFMSCITGTTSNSGKGGNIARPAISYFISFKKGITACETDVFKAIHDNELDANVSTIKTSSQSSDPVMQSLKQVVKDHNSSYSIGIIDEWRRKNEMALKTPCHLVAVDKALSYSLKNAFNNLKSDGMTISYNMEENINGSTKLNIEPMTGIGKAINVVKSAMKELGHALYAGEIYTKAEKGQFAYVPYLSVDAYMQKLLANPVLQDDIILHLPKLVSIISDPECQVISQLIFHFDLIEIRGGYCLKLSSRCFVKTPLSDEDLGVISPRGFSNYHLKERSGGYFESSIRNSFPDVAQRTVFLNKFYQCLLYGQIPHKMKKLVCHGPTDSGKTGWSKIFFGLLRPSKIASITKEKVFGMSMIAKDTELIFIDEWCRETLGTSNVKELFQGGYFIKPVKNQKPAPTENKAPLFILCNKPPDYEEEQDNINSRIAMFPTKALPVLNHEAPEWIKNNAMRCVAWMVREVNAHIDCVPEGDRFYEKEVTDLYDVRLENASINRETERIMALNSTDIKAINIDKQSNATFEVSGEEEVSEENIEKEESSCSDDTDCIDISEGSDVNESDVDLYDISIVPKKVYRYADMNTAMYYKEVRRVINNNMDAQGGRATNLHYVAYMNRFSRANPAVLYTRPEPKLDAWLCLAGKKRDVFNSRGFIQTYPSIKEKIKELRLMCRFQVPSKEARRWQIPEEHSVTAMIPLKRNVPTSSDDDQEESIDFVNTSVKRTGGKKRRKTARVFIESDSELEEINEDLSMKVATSSNGRMSNTPNEMWQEHSESVTFKRGKTEYIMEKTIMIKIEKLSRDMSECSDTRKFEKSQTLSSIVHETSMPPQICDLTAISDEDTD